MNKPLFDLTGITELHRKGIKGKGVKVLVHESDKDAKHALMVAWVIKAIAPEATIERWSHRPSSMDADIKSKYGGYDIVNRSFEGDFSTGKDFGNIMLSASGNSQDYFSKDILDANVIGVASATIATNGLVYHTISGHNPNNADIKNGVEILGFTNIYTPWEMFTGSSCATPFVSGLIALIMSDYKVRGFKLTLDKAREILYSLAQPVLKDNTVVSQVGNCRLIVGKESVPELNKNKIGMGYATLKGYVSPEEEKIVMRMGDTSMFVNGKEVILDVPPTILQGRTMLPVAALASALGLTVLWDDVAKSVTLIIK
jgi:hypothetical protein